MLGANSDAGIALLCRIGDRARRVGLHRLSARGASPSRGAQVPQAEGRLRRREGARRSLRQFEQVPVISITDMVHWNPAFFAVAVSCWPKASVEASPTNPQVLHIRKATSASLS